MKKKLHILYLSSWYPNRLELASGNFLKRQAELIAKEHEVTVLFFKADKNINQFEVVEQKKGNLRELLVYYPQKQGKLNKINQLLHYKRAIDHSLSLLHSRPDIIHANITYPKGREFTYIANKLKLEFILSECSSDFYFENRSKWSLIKKKEIIRTLRHARMVLPSSEFVEKDMLEVEPNFPRYTLPLTVNPSIFYPKKNKKENANFTFLHVSGLDERYKNAKGIVEAFSHVHSTYPNTRLKIVSDSDTSSFVDYIQQHTIDSGVEIITGKNYVEIADVFRESDCFVLFSNYETFSCVAVEALASGIQLIATNVGVVQSLSNEIVLKVLPKEINLLSEAMEKMVQKEFFVGTTTLTDAVKFAHEDEVLAQLTEIYKHCLQSMYER